MKALAVVIAGVVALYVLRTATDILGLDWMFEDVQISPFIPAAANAFAVIVIAYKYVVDVKHPAVGIVLGTFIIFLSALVVLTLGVSWMFRSWELGKSALMAWQTNLAFLSAAAAYLGLGCADQFLRLSRETWQEIAAPFTCMQGS